MKKLITYTLFAVLTVSAFSSCGVYHSIGNANTIGQLSGNPFMQNIAKSVLRNIANNLIQNGVKNVAGKLNLGTNLSSLLSTAQSINGFKNMLTSSYNIAPAKVESGFGNLGTIKDVVNFVAQNGSGFKF